MTDEQDRKNWQYLEDRPEIVLFLERWALQEWDNGTRHSSVQKLVELARHHSPLEADPCGVFQDQ